MTHLAPLAQQLDQIFVLAKHWLLGYVPAGAQPLCSAVLSVVPIIIVFPLLFAITTLLERKGLGQNTEPLRAEPRRSRSDCCNPSPTE